MQTKCSTSRDSVLNHRHSPFSLGFQALAELGWEFSTGGQVAGKGGMFRSMPLSLFCEGGAWGLKPSVPWSTWACPGWAHCQEHLMSPWG